MGIILTVDDQIMSVSTYLQNNGQIIILNTASSVVTNSKNDIIAACLISEWEGTPLVYDIAVVKEYRSSGIATKLLKHSLSALKEKYDFLRLFVYVGNGAESVYYKLGFYPGIQTTHLSLLNN